MITFSFFLAFPWTLLSFYMLTGGGLLEQLMVLMTVAGLSAGGAFMLHRATICCIAYCGPLLASVLFASLYNGIDEYWPLAVYSVVYGCALMIFAVESGRTARQRDISVVDLSATLEELEQAHDEISMLAFTDTIANLPNRKRFVQELDQWIEQAEAEGTSFAFLILDLDRFKNINDIFGHHIGDKLIAELASRIAPSVASDGFVARLGGDEFAVLIRNPGTSVHIKQRAHRLLELVNEAALIDGRQIYPGASIGAAVFPDHADDEQNLLLKADTALRHAKDSGRGQFALFDASLREQIDLHNWMERELRKAIPAGQLVVEYQPKIDLKTEEMVGAEALVRWRHPEKGMIRPDQFLHVAAERGLIPQINQYIFNQVTTDILRWRVNRVPVGRVAINIHPVDLKSPVELMSNLTRMVGRGIKPSDLVLEITEGCFVGRGTEEANDILHTIDSLGFDLALDDFGTGHASLSHLKDLPVKEIKIDKGFVAGVCDKGSDRAIVAATIEIAHGMGLRLVAEGIETSQQLQTMRKLGATTAQGFYWSKSLPAEQVAEFIRSLQPRAESRRRLSRAS